MLCLRSLKSGNTFSEDLIEQSHCDIQTFFLQKPTAKNDFRTAILCHMHYTTLVSLFTDFSNMTEDRAAGLEIISFRNWGRGLGVKRREKSVIQIEW